MTIRKLALRMLGLFDRFIVRGAGGGGCGFGELQLNRFSYRMTRLVVYVCVLALVAGCGIFEGEVEGPCGLAPPSNKFKLEVNNSLDVSVDIATTILSYDAAGNARSVGGFDKSLNNRFLAHTHTQTPFTGLLSICSGSHLPAANRMAYPLFLLTLNSAGQSRHYLAVGGSQYDYETYMRDQLTLPEGTEVLGYGYLYTPGEIIRQELGLPANYVRGTALYTDLKPKHEGHSGSSVVLRLKIEGDNSSDIHWSFLDDFKYKSPYDYAIKLNASPQPTNQAYPAGGSSGSSVAR